MFNVSALLLDDALLKCVVTEVLFSIVAYKIFSDSIIINILLIQTVE